LSAVTSAEQIEQEVYSGSQQARTIASMLSWSIQTRHTLVVAGRHQCQTSTPQAWTRLETERQETDRVAYRWSCRRANKLINASRFKFFHDELESAADCNFGGYPNCYCLLDAVFVCSPRMKIATYVLNLASFFVAKIDVLKPAVARETLLLATSPSSERTH